MNDYPWTVLGRPLPEVVEALRIYDQLRKPGALHVIPPEPPLPEPAKQHLAEFDTSKNVLFRDLPDGSCTVVAALVDENGLHTVGVYPNRQDALAVVTDRYAKDRVAPKRSGWFRK